MQLFLKISNLYTILLLNKKKIFLKNAKYTLLIIKINKLLIILFKSFKTKIKYIKPTILYLFLFLFLLFKKLYLIRNAKDI